MTAYFGSLKHATKEDFIYPLFFFRTLSSPKGVSKGTIKKAIIFTGLSNVAPPAVRRGGLNQRLFRFYGNPMINPAIAGL